MLHKSYKLVIYLPWLQKKKKKKKTANWSNLNQTGKTLEFV